MKTLEERTLERISCQINAVSNDLADIRTALDGHIDKVRAVQHELGVYYAAKNTREVPDDETRTRAS